MLGASHALNCPRGRKNYPCPASHTTDEDTKAQRNAVTCPVLHRDKWLSWDLNSRTLAKLGSLCCTMLLMLGLSCCVTCNETV